MPRRLRRPLTPTLLAVLALLAAPSGALAAGWDATGLPIAAGDTGTQDSAVTTTADGAVWVATSENADADNDTDATVRRITPQGTVGAARVLATDGRQYGGIRLVRVSATEVLVAYVTGAGARLSVRRLGPASTGDPEVLYDQATTVDDDGAANNGTLGYEVLQTLGAPAGAVWVTWARGNAFGSVLETRRLAADGTAGDLVKLGDGYEGAAAVDPSGRLVAVHQSGSQGQVLARRVAADGTAEAPVVIRPSSPPSPPFFSAVTPLVAVDGSGIATAMWRVDTVTSPSRYAEVRRFDTTTDPMTPSGSGPTALTDGLAVDDVQYPAALAADADGDVFAAWSETDSNTSDNDVLVRELGTGALPGAIGARLQLDGSSPDGESPSAIVPETADQSRVLFSGGPNNTTDCRAARVGPGGTPLGTETIASGCSSPTGPPDGAAGLVALWRSFPEGAMHLSRWVEQAPSCADGPRATVVAGRTETLSLPCDGWRPVREVVGAPARGSLGAIDDTAGTVAYTAGATAGTDQVRFRAANAAGASAEHAVAITVVPAPVVDDHPQPTPVDPAGTGDRVAPAISGLRVTPRIARAGAKRAPMLSFSLSEAAQVTVTVERLVTGRRVGGRCRVAGRSRSGARCTLVRKVTATRSTGRAGEVRVTIRGARGRALGAGSYRLTVSAVDAAGNRARPAVTSLLVRARRR